jgi:RelA/SpoT family (p)ppGpp synthetase
MFLISDLVSLLESYLDQKHIEEIYAAYLFSAEAHDGQHRLTGEPYIYHPIEVARILAEMRIDHTTIIAAILHDVLEDTNHPKKELIQRFGKDVTELVDGVSKLTRLQVADPKQMQAENFRKMMLAMTRDIRVILIKLADRLHNMRTLTSMKPAKRRRISRETLEIYAPIAHRLGMNKIATEFKELGFLNYYPARHRVLNDAIKKVRGNNREVLETIEVSIKQRLSDTEISADIQGREKHTYSIYQKMKDQKLPFSEIYDVYAFRIIVPTIESCYQVLGVVHGIYKPVPGKFKDYIAIPKANGYQSLHTILFGPQGVPVEIQIRTHEMHKVSEDGIAAHWDYKTEGSDNITSNSNKTGQRARQWLQDLLELQKNSGDSIEFLESVKIDLFPDEVYIFTPKGKIISLPRGATVLDFAYQIHTDIGDHAIAARINRKPVPLNSRIYNGQTIDITTSSNRAPHPNWLQFVTTSKARSNIRSYLKNLQQEDAIKLGRELLTNALQNNNISESKFKAMDISTLLNKMKIENMDKLYNDIGMGQRIAELVVGNIIHCCSNKDRLEDSKGKQKSKHKSRWNPLSVLSPILKRKDRKRKRSSPLTIHGTEGMVVHFANCCHPINGDTIIGHITPGKGLVIHMHDCNNVSHLHTHPEQWVPVEWSSQDCQELPTKIRVDVANKRGVLATIATSISELESNIDNVTVDDQDGKVNIITLTIRVSDRKHLALIIRTIRKLKTVKTIRRIK